MITMEARALWHISPTQSIIRTQALPSIQPEECVVQTHFSMVSLGTERLVCRGGIGRPAFEKMKVPYMQGDFSFPLTYGYSLTGEVVKGPREWLGERVHCMHPHQDLCIINTQDLTVVPENVPMERAILASNLETAINGVWDAQPMIGERILIIGYGLIGALLAYLLKPMPGIELRIKETNPARRMRALDQGLSVIDEQQPEADRFDLVFHTSATADGLQWGIDMSGLEARIIEMSWYGQQEVKLDLGATFHFGRIRILSSQVSHIARSATPRFDQQRRKSLVFRLLADPVLQSFLGNVIPFSESPDFFQGLRSKPVDELNVCFQYR